MIKYQVQKNAQSRVRKDTCNFLASKRRKRPAILKWMECGKQAQGWVGGEKGTLHLPFLLI